jgi:4,5-DOPA dioxygenase extradiol
VPTEEHYLPLLYVAAMQREDEPLSFFYEGMQNASISMRSLQLG